MSETDTGKRVPARASLRLSYRREDLQHRQILINADRHLPYLPASAALPISIQRVSILDAPPCRLGEGAGYDPQTDTAWWFDLLSGVLHERRIRNNVSTSTRMPGKASLMVPTDQDHPLIAMENGLYIWDRAAGRFHAFLSLNAGAAAKMRTHCGRVHPSGSLWISSMHHDGVAERGTIHLVTGARAQLLYGGLTIPSSICFSPDGSIGYFGDTTDGIIYRVNLDPETGAPIGQTRIFFDGGYRPGGIDGSVVDRAGALWNARWGASSLDLYAPSGLWQKTVPLPARQPTSLAFVGANGENMLIASAAVGLPDNDIDGRTMIMRSLFRGVCDARFKLS